MEELELVGIQVPFGEHPVLMLRNRARSTGYAVGLSGHQVRMLEAAYGVCDGCGEREPAVLGLAAALGRRVLGVAIYMVERASPRTWLVLAEASGKAGADQPTELRSHDRTTGPARLAVPVAPIEAFALVVRAPTRLVRVETDDIDEVCRRWLGPGELPAGAKEALGERGHRGPDIPAPFRAAFRAAFDSQDT
ncbi:MAG: hypothetical protein HY332_19585 [Chloroflexi bacterium]|nr:hypothetical protein [Chloroflexota bacterium]